MTREELNNAVEALKTLRNGATDELAITATGIYPKWRPLIWYTKDVRVRYEGKLYRVLQDHNAEENWTPTGAPSLYAEILPGQGGTEIGEWSQPDSTNPYMKGDKVTFNGKTYESDVDNNVWAPDAYGWQEV